MSELHDAITAADPPLPDPPLPWQTSIELHDTTPAEPAWIFEGYVARGTLALIAGKPKAGKSTLVCAIVDAITSGATTFLDRHVATGDVLYVTEEGAITLRQKLPRTGRLHVLTRERAWPKPAWPALIAGAITEAQRTKAVAIVIDSLSFWAEFGADKEKDNSSVQAVMDKLHAATRLGIAVILVHHQRKGGGEDTEAVRGGNAIVGAVDVVIELETIAKAPRTHRRLIAVGRWPQTPGALVIDRDPATGAWGVHGQGDNRADTAHIAWRKAILAALPDTPPGLTLDQLETDLAEDRRTWAPALTQLLDDGTITRTGEGVRGNPYQHHHTFRGEIPCDPTHGNHGNDPLQDSVFPCVPVGNTETETAEPHTPQNTVDTTTTETTTARQRDLAGDLS